MEILYIAPLPLSLGVLTSNAIHLASQQTKLTNRVPFNITGSVGCYPLGPPLNMITTYACKQQLSGVTVWTQYN